MSSFKLESILLSPLVLSLLSALLFASPWVIDFQYAIFFAFVPLLWMQQKGVKHLLWWAALTFLIWIISTCWWVAMATPLAAVMIPLVGMCFTFLPFALFVKLSKNVSEAVKWILFVTIWLCFEALYTYNDISFPWLTLGHAFEAKTVQWYSVTGVFGGSLLALIGNIFAFKFIWSYFNKTASKKIKIAYCSLFFVVILAPAIISTTIYYTYKEKVNPIEICVIQPNIDPYTEKFGAMSSQEQLDIMLNLAKKGENNTQFFVAPETAIEGNLWLERLAQNVFVDTISGFIRNNFPKATFVTGATTLRVVNPSEKFDYNTYKSGDQRFQVYNSALWIDSSSNVDVYHKAKLVCGAEMIPYPSIFKAIDDVLKVDLGGFSGRNGKSIKRDVYKNSGTAICYEAIYGEFYTDYVKNGAQFMFIISNDGWWGDTFGYKHLLKYSAHRAVETRRSIARSANTGISAIINQKGDVVEQLGWDKRGVINSTINANDEITFYVKNGDYIIRIAFYLLLLTLGYMVSMKYYKKNNSI